MLALLRQPRWIALGTLVGLVALLFVNLGLWQARRLEERRFDNAIQSERRAASPVPVDVALDVRQDPLTAGEEHEGRPLIAKGTFDPSEEFLLRSRTLDGEAGFHVVTPLVLADGNAILVNRGWVPLSMGEVPLSGRAASPAGSVEVIGLAAGSATQPRFGPVDPTGDADVFARADISRIQDQVPYRLFPVLLVSQIEAELPVVVTPEELDDGPHLAYAIQWFSFAAISLGGFAALLRSTAKKDAERRSRFAEAASGSVDRR